MENILLSLLIMPLFSIIIQMFAYIDPGTGSIILQAIIAGVAGAAIAIKLFWHRIIVFLGLRNKDKSEITDDEDDSEN